MNEVSGNVSVLEVQLKGFAEVRERFIYGLTLAGHLDLEATSHEPTSVLADGCGKCAGLIHVPRVPGESPSVPRTCMGCRRAWPLDVTDHRPWCDSTSKWVRELRVWQN